MLYKEFNLSHYFDNILVSSRVKIIKPDPRFYQMMFNSLQVAPQEVVYIDDRDYQVVGAQKLGMRAILYQNSEQLEKSLYDVIGLQ